MDPGFKLRWCDVSERGVSARWRWIVHVMNARSANSRPLEIDVSSVRRSWKEQDLGQETRNLALRMK